MRGATREQGERDRHAREIPGHPRVTIDRDEVGDLAHVDARVNGCRHPLLDADRLLGVPRFAPVAGSSDRGGERRLGIEGGDGGVGAEEKLSACVE